MRYSDLYAATVLNLHFYPFSYMFRAPPMLLPHESTVSTEASNFTPSDEMAMQREEDRMDQHIMAQKKKAMTSRMDSGLPHLYAPEPDASIQNHELDEEHEEEEEDSSK